MLSSQASPNPGGIWVGSLLENQKQLWPLLVVGTMGRVPFSRFSRKLLGLAEEGSLPELQTLTDLTKQKINEVYMRRSAWRLLPHPSEQEECTWGPSDQLLPARFCAFLNPSGKGDKGTQSSE